MHTFTNTAILVLPVLTVRGVVTDPGLRDTLGVHGVTSITIKLVLTAAMRKFRGSRSGRGVTGTYRMETNQDKLDHKQALRYKRNINSLSSQTLKA